MSDGRPAVSGFIIFARSSLSGKHVVAHRLDQPEALQLVELSGICLARSLAWLQSLVVS